MQISLSTDSIEGYPLIIASGQITEDSLIELGRFVRQSCEDSKVNGAIIDCQAIQGALSPEVLQNATPAYTQEIGRTLKVAYINPPAHWKPSDDQFSRDLAYNRGGLLELFDTATEAVQWFRRS
jgi:hypothetical protein